MIYIVLYTLCDEYTTEMTQKRLICECTIDIVKPIHGGGIAVWMMIASKRAGFWRGT